MLMQVVYIVCALLLVLLNGFFVLAEFAIVKVRNTRLKELAREGNDNAERALRIAEKMDRYLAACQLGITVASLALGWIGEPAFAHLLEPLLQLPGLWPKVVSHSISIGGAFVLITFLHITIGEQVPKLYAVRKAERAALFSARPLRFFYFIFYPFLLLLNAASNFVLRLIGMGRVSEAEHGHSEEELRMILGASHERGQFTLSRLLMMENLLDFGQLSVVDVMVDSAKVVTVDASLPWPENFDRMRKAMHSRYPLRRPDRPRVDSEIHIKDVTMSLGRNPNQPPDLVKLARRVAVVRPTLTLEALLTQFHQMGTHMAVVEDEQGKWVGIVTMEDVIEELIGTIRDEFEPVKEERLIDLVPEAAIELGLTASTKEEAIRKICQKLATAVPVSAEAVVQAVLKREALASTGLGEGVAIPHARVAGLSRPVAAFARSAGVEFGSLDGRPAELIFLIATPPHDEGAHVRVLAKISRLLSSDYLKERLIRAETPAEVREIFDVSDKSVPA